MQKNLKFIFLAPLFMAVLCEDISDDCGIENPEAYIVNVENSAESYTLGETFWLNSETSSELINYCNTSEETEIIFDNFLFLDALFVLKLNSTSSDYNAEIAQDVEVIYDIGEDFNGDYCLDAIECLPELSEDNLVYQYRLGVSISTPGDYCIVNGRNSFFNLEQENNAQIFELYNTLNNTIKFENCENMYTRNGTEGFYFFRVQ